MISPTIIQEKHSNENNEAIKKIFSVEYNKTSSSIQNQIAEINESKKRNYTVKLSKFKWHRAFWLFLCYKKNPQK